jgi:nitrate/TMAO reductase-like tetraheme cytochrome c subunit
MAKISLAGFKDPARRPRYIIWTGVALLILAAVLIVALGVTSTRWFCAEGCHKVQDDSIIAYQRSSHNNVSCMACHMPVNADPITFVLHKAEALGELYLTVTDNFELPLNAESHVSLTMTSEQCTQCHNLSTRVITPTEGIKIDHEAHSEINAACTVCHNRVAHREDFELTGKDPKTGTTRKHVNFMSMTSCFRCHGLEKGAAAPGACQKCHTPGFKLKPKSHDDKEFYPGGHAEMAKELKAEAEEAAAEGAEGEAEAEKEQSLLTPEKAYASGGGSGKEPVAKKDVPQVIAAQRQTGADDHANIGEELPKVETIFECTTCHADTFCNNCHGMEMPHPAAFKEPKDVKDAVGHPAMSADKDKAKKCVECHGKNEDTHFCDDCHHGTAVKFEFDKKVAWTKQHPKAVEKSGLKACTDSCHSPKFCVDCHSNKKVYPASHKDKTWTKPAKPAMTVYGKTPAAPAAKHSLDAQKSIDSCAICHGSGGVNAAFCKSCHKLDMPHPAEFKKQHVGGKKTPAVCRNCHNWKEMCSNCHHIGSSTPTGWVKVHGGSVNKNGAEGCVEKCHKKNDCVSCHQKRKAVPNSHKAKLFVRDYSAKAAQHAALYTKNADSCTYCHSGAAAELPNSKFCTRCHGLKIPHPAGFGLKSDSTPAQKDNGGQHAELLKNAQSALPKTCANCHKVNYCDSCHHKGLDTKKSWKSQHNTYVKKNTATGCFGGGNGCHEETFCSYCHVRLAR